MAYKIVNCEKGDLEYICNKLVQYNLSKVPKTQEKEFEDINIKYIDDENNIIAGCIARMYCWNVVYVDVLWVDELYKNKGFGSKLINEIEQIAKEKECDLIHLDTFDFQAKDFYLKHGYEIFGVLEGCPKEHCRYYLKKII